MTANQIHFFIRDAIAFLVFGLIARWYVWPAVKDRAPALALTPLLLYACLRVDGLMFVMPGLSRLTCHALSQSRPPMATSARLF